MTRKTENRTKWAVESGADLRTKLYAEYSFKNEPASELLVDLLVESVNGLHDCWQFIRKHGRFYLNRFGEWRKHDAVKTSLEYQDQIRMLVRELQLPDSVADDLCRPPRLKTR